MTALEIVEILVRIAWLAGAVAFATMNVVGGYVVTDRMLQMFPKKPVAPKPATDDAEAAS